MHKEFDGRIVSEPELTILVKIHKILEFRNKEFEELSDEKAKLKIKEILAEYNLGNYIKFI